MSKVFITILAIFILPQLNAQNLLSNIFDAARNGDTVAIDSLFRINPDTINSLDQNNHSPLILASYHNQTEAVRLLTRKGANINYVFSQGSAIHGAAFKGFLEIVDFLISKGIIFDDPDENGTTPLIYATLFHHNEVAILLFEKGADINHKDKTGSSALDYAMSLQNFELIKLFNTN